jgi:hypothetical protein
MFDIAAIQKPADQALHQDGLSLLLPADLAASLQLPTPQWTQGWNQPTDAWDRLPPDAHLKDGGNYRNIFH